MLKGHGFYPPEFEDQPTGRLFWIYFAFYRAQRAREKGYIASWRFWTRTLFRAFLNIPRKGGWWHHPKDSTYRL